MGELRSKKSRKLAVEFPKRFSSRHEALSHAGVVSQEYSR
jgi:hypothetical protein